MIECFSIMYFICNQFAKMRLLFLMCVYESVVLFEIGIDINATRWLSDLYVRAFSKIRS